jgi:hypothetical protein
MYKQFTVPVMIERANEICLHFENVEEVHKVIAIVNNLPEHEKNQKKNYPMMVKIMLK